MKSAIVKWRRGERERLILARLAIPAETRGIYARRICAKLTEMLGRLDGKIVSIYWPIRGEPDLRRWVETIGQAGGLCAMPVVEADHAPLIFRPYNLGTPMKRGVWNIPIPDIEATVRPDIVIAPVVGYDSENYRLGYGGGYFDRTFAAMPNKSTMIGVGYSSQKIATIKPQPHDIAMDVVVTEE